VIAPASSPISDAVMDNGQYKVGCRGCDRLVKIN
jgi:hypothetical protein